jgi:hypothetical protein
LGSVTGFKKFTWIKRSRDEKYTVALKDGSTKKETSTFTFNLSPSIDSTGANIWLAAEAK